MARRQRDSRRRVALALEFVDADARKLHGRRVVRFWDNDVAKLFRGDGDAKRDGPLAFCKSPGRPHRRGERAAEARSFSGEAGRRCFRYHFW